MEINWDAHLITVADELYHTVWETISESTMIKSPLSGILEEINTSDVHLDSNTNLFSVRTDESSLQTQVAVSDAMNQDEYTQFIQSTERGKFYDPNDE